MFSILDNISIRIGYQYKIKTSKLNNFINTYGVNFIDKYGIHILNLHHDMSYKQIDIILSYQPNILFLNKQYLVRIPLINCGIAIEKTCYILEKMLEYDHDFIFISYKMKFKYGGFLTFLDFYKRLQSYANQGFYKHLDKCVDMLENHLKHYQSLFMIMLPEIE